MANSFTFGGVDFGALGLTVMRGERPFFPGIERAAVSLGLGDGEAFGPSRYKGREITLECVVRAASYAALKTAKDTIAAALNLREDSALILDTQSDRYWLARLTESSGFRVQSPRLALLTLTFASGEPFAFSTSETTKSVSLTLEGQAVSCTVAGSAETWPTIAVTVNTTIASWGIANETFDRRLAWAASPTSLVSGDVVTVYCDPIARDAYGEPISGQVVTIKRSGEATGVIRMAGIEGYFPKLSTAAPTLTFWGLRGSAVITHRNRYMG